MKACAWCGEDYVPPRKNSRYCSKDHFNNCQVCGEAYLIKEMKRPGKVCSSSKCHRTASMINKKGVEKNCELCGKSFLADKVTAKRCGDDHFSNCTVCGDEFKLLRFGTATKTCSPKCASMLIDYTDRNAKSSKTMMSKYGVENISQLQSIKEQKKETTLANYGVENPSYSEVVKNRKKETFIKNYGFDHPMKSKEHRDKVSETVMKKYGVPNVFMNDKIKEVSKVTMLSKYGVENIFQLPEVQLKAAQNSGFRISQVNVLWRKKLLDETGISFDFEIPFADPGSGKTYYADLGYENVLIDINPTFTHNSTNSFVHSTGRCKDVACVKKSHEPRSSTYHQERALAAERAGKVLLQFFDWFDEDIFINVVKAKLKVNEKKFFAKDTVLREISQADANRFLRVNHLMGASNSQSRIKVVIS